MFFLGFFNHYAFLKSGWRKSKEMAMGWHNEAKIVILIDGTTLKCQRGIQHKAIVFAYDFLVFAPQTVRQGSASEAATITCDATIFSTYIILRNAAGYLFLSHLSHCAGGGIHAVTCCH